MNKLVNKHDWSTSEISHVLINDQLLDVIKCSSSRKEYENREVIFAIMKCVRNFQRKKFTLSPLDSKFSILMLPIFLVHKLSEFGSWISKQLQ